MKIVVNSDEKSGTCADEANFGDCDPRFITHHSSLITYQRIVGGYSERVPPLPIPNREVKPLSADGTALGWESRSLPTQYNTQPHSLTRMGLSCVWR